MTNHVCEQLHEGCYTSNRKHENRQPRKRREIVEENDHCRCPKPKTPRAPDEICECSARSMLWLFKFHFPVFFYFVVELLTKKCEYFVVHYKTREAKRRE